MLLLPHRVPAKHAILQIENIKRQSLDKLDRMEKRLDALESTAAQRQATLTRTPTKTFADYVRVPEKSDEILAQLHLWIDKTYRVKALVYIKAAIEAKVLTRPPFVVADAEFPGHLGGQYAGEPMSFAHEKDLMELKEAVAVLT